MGCAECGRCGLTNVASNQTRSGTRAKVACLPGALTVAEMHRILEAEFAPRPAAPRSLGGLEQARQRLMQRVPRLVALTGPALGASFDQAAAG
jgi:hypothetical protein